MKHLFAVSLELYHDPSESRAFDVEHELRRIAGFQAVRSLWLVEREGTASDLAQFVSQFLLKDDRLFVVEITGQPSFKNPRVTLAEIDALFRG